MKLTVSFLILSVGLVCLAAAISSDQNGIAKAVAVEKETEEWLTPKEAEKKIQEEVDDFPIEDVPESEVGWNQMVEETVALWDLFLNWGDAPSNDPRRGYLEEYAGYLADTVIAYQNRETDIGGRLPRHNSTHLIIAQTFTQESSIRPEVVGKKSEVGFMQVHGRALAGIDPEFVKKKPKLGIYLGVRWLAASIPKCFPDGFEDQEWDDNDWIKVLSVYQAGERNGKKKDGTCKELKTAKKRVGKMKMYKAWIDAELGNQ